MTAYAFRVAELGLLHRKHAQRLRNVTGCKVSKYAMDGAAAFSPQPAGVVWTYLELRALLRAFKLHGVVFDTYEGIHRIAREEEWFRATYGWTSPKGMIHVMRVVGPQALEALFRLAPTAKDRERFTHSRALMVNIDGVSALENAVGQALVTLKNGWAVHRVNPWGSYTREREREYTAFLSTQRRLDKEHILDQLKVRKLGA